MKDIVLAEDEILVLRDVKPDMSSHGGFVWPESGIVEAPDWEPTDRCGHGLHGLPWGEGGDYHIGGANGKWLAVRVSTAPANYRSGAGELFDKCKFRAGEVVYCGNREGAAALIQRYAPAGTRCNWSTQTAGYRSTQTAGNWSHMRAGLGTAQVGRWYDGLEWRVAMRQIGEAEADRWYRFLQGAWTLLDAVEASALDAKTHAAV